MKILSYEDKLPFGKYKGRLIIDIVFINPQYLWWFSQNIKNYKLPEQLVLNLSDTPKKQSYSLEHEAMMEYHHGDWGDRDDCY